MKLLSRIRNLLTLQPKEQIAGYSKAELKAIFPSGAHLPPSPQGVIITSLEDIGVRAYYSALLIDAIDLDEFRTIVASLFTQESERSFNELPVKQLKSLEREEKLIYFSSNREFNSITIRQVTNSTTYLDALDARGFAVPAPWIVFQGYEPEWWSEDMQGAQQYFNDNYFSPFFQQLSGAKRSEYYSRYGATNEWMKYLERIYPASS